MTDYFYKEQPGDEVIFIHVGSGKLKTGFGEIKFAYGDYWLYREEQFTSLNLTMKITVCSSSKALALFARLSVTVTNTGN